MPQDVLHELSAAAKDLLYPSESDSPFEPFVWPTAPNDSPASQVAAHSDPSKTIKEIPLPDFFAQLDDSDDAARFRQLKAALQRLLADPRVFRVGIGQVQVDIYILGRTPNNNWAGLHTLSIET